MFEKNIYTKTEQKIFNRLNDPKKIQKFLNELKYNFDYTVCRSPRKVLETRTAYCLEGALFAASALQYNGYKPLLLDMRPIGLDYDHVVALFQKDGYWGALSKTNHAVLRYRDPIYKNMRELVLSYFHEYFLDNGIKTLKDYSVPIDLSKIDQRQWQVADGDLWDVIDFIDKAKHTKIISDKQRKNLRKADDVEIEAGKILQWRPKKN